MGGCRRPPPAKPVAKNREEASKRLAAAKASATAAQVVCSYEQVELLGWLEVRLSVCTVSCM